MNSVPDSTISMYYFMFCYLIKFMAREKLKGCAKVLTVKGHFPKKMTF